MSRTVRKRLIPLLAPNLRVVFVGTEPGRRSLLEGRYYADPSNSFYVGLRESDWTPGRALKPEEFRELLLYGIGLDDVYYRPELLRRRLSKRKPSAVCFNSKEALERFVGRKLSGETWTGEAAARHARFGWKPLVWAIPDSSGQARGHAKDRIKLLCDLRQVLENEAR